MEQRYSANFHSVHDVSTRAVDRSRVMGTSYTRDTRWRWGHTGLERC